MAMFMKETDVMTPEPISLFPTATEQSKRNSRSLDLTINTTASSSSTSTTSDNSSNNSPINSRRHQHHTRSTSDGGTEKKDIIILTSGMPVQNTEDSLSAALPSPTTPNTVDSSTNSSSLLFNFGLASSRKQSFCSILQKVRKKEFLS